MFNSKLAALLGGVVFLLIALCALYRLTFWFPVEIAGVEIGGAATFLVFAIFAALSLISFQGLRRGGE